MLRNLPIARRRTAVVMWVVSLVTVRDFFPVAFGFDPSNSSSRWSRYRSCCCCGNKYIPSSVQQRHTAIQYRSNPLIIPGNARYLHSQPRGLRRRRCGGQVPSAARSAGLELRLQMETDDTNDEMIGTALRVGSNKDNSNKNEDDGYWKRLLVLATVPMAWGTFEPAVRLVYKNEPSIPPLVFSVAYYFVATAALTLAKTLVVSSSSSSAANNVSPPPEARAASERSAEEIVELQGTNESLPDRVSVSGLPLSLRGGFELGTYLFVGNALQVIGLKTVSSDRAAVLLQLTTVFVPLLKSITAFFQKKPSVISKQTWIACLVALVGVVLIGLDQSDPSSSANGSVDFGTILGVGVPEIIAACSDLANRVSFSLDDGCIVLGAVFYTFHCVRLETYAKSTEAIALATSKATTELAWSGLSIAGCVGLASASASALRGGESSVPAILDRARSAGDTIRWYGNDVAERWSSYPVGIDDSAWLGVIGATIWIGAVTVAYTIYSQSYGQSRVPAVTANLIYTSQPLFTALVAYAVLGESLGPNECIGGALIGAAVSLVIRGEISPTHDDTKRSGGDAA